MQQIVIATLLSAVWLGSTSHSCWSQDKPATPSEQYKALLKTYQEASGGGAPNDAERYKLIGRVYRLRSSLAQKFVELAERYSTDPIAVDALTQALWQVNGTPWPVELVGEDPAQARALELLERDYIRSPKLGDTCERISYGFRKEYETFLRSVLAKSPHKDVRARACLGLAHFLTSRANRVEIAKEEPELARVFEGLYGREYVQELERQDRRTVEHEAESLFKHAAAKYAEVKLEDDETVAKKASAELYEMKHLSPGKEAPEIDGKDQDGKPFKLSDYRGKVVLLDFWHQQ